MTTTIKIIRDKQAALVGALLSPSMSNRKFKERRETDLEEWAEKNPKAALRRFSVEDLFEYDEVLSSNSDSEELITNVRLLVAYPKDTRYGPNNENSQRDLIREDMHQIDTALGHRGAVGYVSGQNAAIAVDKEIIEGLAVDFLAMTFEVNFRRAF